MIIIQEKQNVHEARHFFFSSISFPFDLNNTQLWWVFLNTGKQMGVTNEFECCIVSKHKHCLYKHKIYTVTMFFFLCC